MTVTEDNVIHTEADLRTTLAVGTGERAKLEAEVTRVRQPPEGQARLVKKLQRKMLLVTKKRDSFKSILESYEKEMTVTEDNVIQDEINALKTNAMLSRKQSHLLIAAKS